MDQDETAARRPWVLALVLGLVTVGVIVLLIASEPSGTGAENVGDSGEKVLRPPPPDGAPGPDPEPGRTTDRAAVNCEATESNPGGDNNYIPDAPARDSLGEGFVIEGFVRSAAGCRPLRDIPVRVWLATSSGGETENRATVRTDAEGRYRIPSDPTIPQFGEPNIHVAYDGDAYEPVFIRRVVDLDDARAVVNLTLREDG